MVEKIGKRGGMGRKGQKKWKDKFYKNCFAKLKKIYIKHLIILTLFTIRHRGNFLDLLIRSKNKKPAGSFI